jgi:hypothetical protein
MKLKKEYKDKINYLFDVLKKNDIKVLDVNFSGSGDEGNMEINGHDGPDNVNFDEPTIFQDDIWSNGSYKKDYVPLEELIYNVADYVLNERGVDYANGNGNDGTVYFEVEKRQISMTYLVTTDERYSFNV